MGRAALQKKSLEDYKKYCDKNGKYATGYAQWLKRTNTILKRKKSYG